MKLAKNYCKKIFDGTHDTPKPISEGVPLVTSKHIVGRKLDLSTAYNISQDDYLSIQKRSSVRQWDILFSMIGSVGEVYLEQNENIPYAIKNIGVFSCYDEYQAKWLYYYLQSPSAKTHIKRYLNGAVQKFLSLGALRDFPVLEYDNSKNQIIDVLSDLDAKIELNNKINRELEAMAKTLYDYWFVQFDFPNEQGKPYKSSGGKMVYNEELKREIPEGWEVEKISDCCGIVDCLHSKKSDYIFEDKKCYLLQLENIRDDGLIGLENKYYVSKEEYKKWTTRIEIKDHDLVITNAGRVASLAQVSKDIIAGIGRNITAIRPVRINPTFLYYSFQGAEMKRQIKLNTDFGIFFNSLNVRGIKELHIVRAPKEIEDNFEQISLSKRRQRELNIKQNQQLTDLRDWLLPMLMNGQVTIRQAYGTAAKEAEEMLSMAAEPQAEYKKG